VLPRSMRWALAGYAIPVVLICAAMLLIRGGPVTAQPYNYALMLLVVLLVSAAIAVVCLVVASVLAVQSLRLDSSSVRWPQYAVLLAAVAPTVVAAFWLTQ
jgi:hypothetical protein